MSVQKRGGVGVIIITPEGETLKYGVQLVFLATDNEVEYEGVLIGLKVRKALGVKKFTPPKQFKAHHRPDKGGI